MTHGMRDAGALCEKRERRQPKPLEGKPLKVTCILSLMQLFPVINCMLLVRLLRMHQSRAFAFGLSHASVSPCGTMCGAGGSGQVWFCRVLSREPQQTARHTSPQVDMLQTQTLELLQQLDAEKSKRMRCEDELATMRAEGPLLGCSTSSGRSSREDELGMQVDTRHTAQNLRHARTGLQHGGHLGMAQVPFLGFTKACCGDAQRLPKLGHWPPCEQPAGQRYRER